MSLHDLHLKYRDRVQFLVVYIREAHPLDGWRLPGTTAPEIYDPKTIEERRAVAGRCEIALQYDISTYVDTMNDAVSKAYAAHPTRLYLVGRDGRVVYAGGLGPAGFKPAELGAALDKYLAQVGTT
ncbi:MAG: hypothetical protein HY667_05555 [Chloroflexi bacterium]|nr:hypothetical protein [Chloroflexota bacterium]